MARAKIDIDIPAAEARFILEALHRDGRLSRQLLREYRAEYGREIESLETRLAQLRSLAASALPALAGAAVGVALPATARAVRKARPGRKVKRSSAKSNERVAIQRLQGRYLSLLRKVPASQKARFGREAIAAKGKEAVIQELESYLAKPQKGLRGRKK